MRNCKSIVVLFFIYATFSTAFSQEAPKNIDYPGKKIFSFGVVADIQYADKENSGNRFYRAALGKLDHCIDIFNRYELSFVANLGDLVDQGYSDYDTTLAMLDKFKAPVYNVLGNHDLAVEDEFKETAKEQLLGDKNGYYTFEVGDFIFMVLDGTEMCPIVYPEGSKQYNIAMAKYEYIKTKGLNNAYTWNGGFGDEQINWIGKVLKKAERENRKVVIFCHWPLLPENGVQLWDNQVLLGLIESHHSVVAWISGHHHEGNYVKEMGIHHLTLKAIVNAVSETSCGIIEVYSDKLLFKGYGDMEDRILDFPM